MKLHEIIKALENPESSVLIEVMQPYFKSLRAYYTAHGTRFNSELILMVTSVTNATAYARIEPADEFSEALEQYIDTMELETEEEKEQEREVIGSQSIFLNQLINK